MIDEVYKSLYIEKSPQAFRLAAIFLFANTSCAAYSSTVLGEVVEDRRG